MAMYESGENYLETILLLTNEHGKVRSVDIANHLGFSKPSVSRAMNLLKNSQYITVEPSGNILLTDKGFKTASEIYERHQLITKYLIMTLGVDEETAATDACRIEHVISTAVFEKIKQYTMQK